MSPGNLTLTCLLLVAGQAPADVTYFNERAMGIPIDIDPARRREIKELILFVSADRGKSWDRYASEAPDKKAFTFRASADGEYWFRIAAVDFQGRQQPENVNAGPPQQKVIIDTRNKPSLRIVSATRVGDEVVVKWEAQADPLPPVPNSLKLEYRMLDGSASVWFPVGITAGPTGEARARVLSPGRVAVRMQFRDVAGNLASHEAEVPGTDGVASNSSPVNQGTLPAPPPPAPIIPVIGPPETNLPPPGAAGPSKLAAPPPVAPGVAAQSGAGSPVSPPDPPVAVNPPQPVGGGPEHATGQTPSRGGTDSEPVATTARGQTTLQPGLPAPAPAPHRAAPPVRLVNTREVALEYQLSRLGPSGIGSVILYLTADGGQKWAEFKDEKPDLSNAAIGSKYQRVLTLPPGEGVYGLILVVQNKGKIGKPKPKPGDVPEMIIEVDLTPPNAKLWGPQVDPERRDAVVLQWAAQDKNLPANPVILEWAEKAQGQWKVIATDLPGTGKYSWQVPAGTPVEVYLRLRVRDNAGNEAVAVTDTPQTIDLVEPEGKLIGVHPVGH